MRARIFQGPGRGAFDTLVFASIQHTFFEHELRIRLGMHQVVAVVATWGFPLVDGASSRRAGASKWVSQARLTSSVLRDPSNR